MSLFVPLTHTNTHTQTLMSVSTWAAARVTTSVWTQWAASCVAVTAATSSHRTNAPASPYTTVSLSFQLSSTALDENGWLFFMLAQQMFHTLEMKWVLFDLTMLFKYHSVTPIMERWKFGFVLQWVHLGSQTRWWVLVPAPSPVRILWIWKTVCCSSN